MRQTDCMAGEFEAVQVARRRLEVVAVLQRHRFAIGPAQRLAIHPEEVFEVPRMKMSGNSGAGSAYRNQKKKLSGGVGVFGEKGIASKAPPS